MTQDRTPLGLQRPGRVVSGLMIGLFGVWLGLALGVNFLGLSPAILEWLVGDTEAVLRGEVWRFATAPLVHVTSGSIGHIVSSLLGLLFLAPSLETEWGPRRFLGFVGASALIAYGVQFVWAITVPAALAARTAPEVWFGFMPVITALSVAWALSFQGREIRLFLVLPVSSRALLWIVIGMNLLAFVALSGSPAGPIAPLGAMLSGWLLGGGTPSPLRRWWLRARLRRLDAEVERERKERQARVARSGLRVIDGGSRDEPPPSSPRRRPGGEWLN